MNGINRKLDGDPDISFSCKQIPNPIGSGNEVGPGDLGIGTEMHPRDQSGLAI